MDFNTSTPLTIRYSGKIGIEVNLERQYANGIVIHQIKQLSNKNVMIVFPPERIVKYVACKKALTGIYSARIRINPVARCRISSVVS